MHKFSGSGGAIQSKLCMLNILLSACYRWYYGREFTGSRLQLSPACQPIGLMVHVNLSEFYRTHSSSLASREAFSGLGGTQCQQTIGEATGADRVFTSGCPTRMIRIRVGMLPERAGGTSQMRL